MLLSVAAGRLTAAKAPWKVEYGSTRHDGATAAGGASTASCSQAAGQWVRRRHRRQQAGLRQRWTPEGWRRLDGAMRSTTARPDAQITPHVQSTSRIERHHRRRSSAQRPHLQKARQKLEFSNLVAVTSAVQETLTMAMMGLHIDLSEETHEWHSRY